MLVNSRVNQETNGTFPFKRTTLQTVPLLKTKKSTPSNKIYKPTGTFNYNRKNVVYLFRCRKCPDAYKKNKSVYPKSYYRTQTNLSTKNGPTYQSVSIWVNPITPAKT